MANKLFLGGMPTDTDVRKLVDAFSGLKTDTEITHEQVEACTGLDRNTSRYRTVTVAWRKRLLNEQNMEVGALKGVGFRVLNDGDRIAAAVTGVKQGARKQIKSIKKAVMVNTADPILQRRQEILTRVGVGIQSEMTNMARQIEPPKSKPQMPRLPPSGA